MKKSFVFIPAVIVILFLIYSFVSKEEKTTLKSIDGGQTWQTSNDGPYEIHKQAGVIRSEGVLIATGSKGIKRSTDNGAHWQWVISENGVGIAVEPITGGFAAISYDAKIKSRRIDISLDKGKTWHKADNGLRPSPNISSIKQVGNYLICGHPDGIFRSADMGKTWVKVHSGTDDKSFTVLPTFGETFNEPKDVFKLYVSDNVIYAVADNAGC